MSIISKEQVLEVAHIARFEINEEEAESFTERIDRIFTMAEMLSEVDTTGIEPTTHVFARKNIMREDVVDREVPLQEILKNVPNHKDGQIKVPTILE